MNGRKHLHAEDFELVNPGRATFSKDRYLGAVASGEMDYVVCEVDSPMRVRVRPDAAVIRYRLKLQVTFKNQAQAYSLVSRDTYPGAPRTLDHVSRGVIKEN